MCSDDAYPLLLTGPSLDIYGAGDRGDTGEVITVLVDGDRACETPSALSDDLVPPAHRRGLPPSPPALVGHHRRTRRDDNAADARHQGVLSAQNRIGM